jgi:hypothetical protein
MSNYFTKLPDSFLKILFGSRGAQPSFMVAPGAHPKTQFLAPFKPKADLNYMATIAGRTASRTRKHETLVNDFARWLSRRGYEVGRNVAIDLGLLKPPVIIEAKVVGTPAKAIREAVSQLYEYRYFQVADP